MAIEWTGGRKSRGDLAETEQAHKLPRGNGARIEKERTPGISRIPTLKHLLCLSKMRKRNMLSIRDLHLLRFSLILKTATFSQSCDAN